MVRNLILRFPIFRAFVPRISQPILPSQLASLLVHPPSQDNHQERVSSTTALSVFPLPLPLLRPETPTSLASPNASLSQRLKHLIKSYGWYALGIYVFLSVADFTVAFAGINLIGAEHVARFTAAAKNYVTSIVYSRPPEPGREEMDSVSVHASTGGQESLYAMIVLAYTVHKTLFLPIRVGLTATLTPKLVRWLGSRGWAGGAGAKRAAREMRDRMRSGREKD